MLKARRVKSVSGAIIELIQYLQAARLPMARGSPCACFTPSIRISIPQTSAYGLNRCNFGVAVAAYAKERLCERPAEGQ